MIQGSRRQRFYLPGGEYSEAEREDLLRWATWDPVRSAWYCYDRSRIDAWLQAKASTPATTPPVSIRAELPVENPIVARLMATVELWFERMHYGESTRYIYRSYVRKFAEWFAESGRTRIDYEAIDAYISGDEDSIRGIRLGWTQTTAHQRKAKLAHWLEFCVRNQLLC